MKESFDTHLIAVGIDMQNDFCPGGALAVRDGDKVVPAFNAVAATVRDLSGDVVFTRDWHPAQTTHFDKWPRHCVAHTAGAEFHPELVVAEGDIVLSKGMGTDEDAYSGFQAVAADQATTLESLIRQHLTQNHGVQLLIGGLATDYCVKETVLDALKLQKLVGAEKLGVAVLNRCIRAVNLQPTDGVASLAEMEAAGARIVS